MKILYWSIHFLLNGYMRTVCRLEMRGVENIPREGGLIIASNHIAGADPFLLGSAVPRELHFMAKEELFRPYFLRLLLPRLNAFPVNRAGFDIEVIRKSIDFLKQGKALIMFPEGTRSRDGQIREAKTGVGMLAHRAGVAILPTYIENTRKAWWNLLLRKRLRIAFGRPIEADWICNRPSSKAGYKEISDELMDRIKEVKARGFDDATLSRSIL